MPFVKGIDVSVFDPVINWAKVRNQGYRFAYIRSSYGVENNITKTDTMFHAHWAGAKAAGMLRGVIMRPMKRARSIVAAAWGRRSTS